MNLALGRHEDEHVAGTIRRDFGHGVGDRLLQVRLVPVLIRMQRAIEDVDRVRPARHLNHRHVSHDGTEVVGKPLRVDRGRGDDDLQLAPLQDQPVQIAEQEVDVERPLVSLIDDDRVVLVEPSVVLILRQQNPVGHQLDVRLR